MFNVYSTREEFGGRTQTRFLLEFGEHDSYLSEIKIVKSDQGTFMQ